MTIKELKEQVRSLVGNTKIDKAIELLTDWAAQNDDNDFKNALVQIKSHFKSLKNKIISGIIDGQEERITRAQIVNRILGLLDMIPEPKSAKPPKNSFPESLPEFNVPEPSNSMAIPPPPPAPSPVFSIERSASIKMPTVPAPQPTGGGPLQGGLLYNIPPKMPNGVETKCVVRIAFDKKILNNTTDIFQSPVSMDIRVAELMEVELKELGNNGAFEITALNDKQQFLDGFSATEWQFYVKPLKVGNFKLLLKVAIIERINDVDRRKEAVLEQSISVITEGGVPQPAPMKSFLPDFKEVKPENGIKTILFMGANPPGTTKLQLEVEHSRIAAELNSSFKLPVSKFVNVSDMNKLIIINRPNIIHFSGHGKDPETGEQGADGIGRGVGRPQMPKSYEKTGGILVFDEDMRSMKVIEDKALKFLFKAVTQQFKIPLEVVVFNSCHSASQAKAVGAFVPYVVGTSRAIKDATAISFATGFYFGLANGMSIEDAFTSGKINAVLDDTSAEDLIILYKNGVKM